MLAYILVAWVGLGDLGWRAEFFGPHFQSSVNCTCPKSICRYSALVTGVCGPDTGFGCAGSNFFHFKGFKAKPCPVLSHEPGFGQGVHLSGGFRRVASLLERKGYENNAESGRYRPKPRGPQHTLGPVRHLPLSVQILLGAVLFAGGCFFGGKALFDLGRSRPSACRRT